jgi:hypothetical protein
MGPHGIRYRKWRFLFISILALFILVKLTKSFLQPPASQTLNELDVLPITVVVAATTKDNLTMLEQESGLGPKDEQIVYIADNPHATYSVPMNKGNEAMVYLSFLIDRYHNLPEIMVFMHAGRIAWHNNDLLQWSSALMVSRLRRSYIHNKGFVNLLCDIKLRSSRIYHATESGFPAYVLTREDGLRPELRHNTDSEYARFHEIWSSIFPGRPVPTSLGSVAGAQFALTRETARKIPLDELIRLRQWIIDAGLDAKSAGAVFEVVWHMIFVPCTESVLCPIPLECYCSLYGICLEHKKDSPSSGQMLLEEAAGYWHQALPMISTLRRINQFVAQNVTIAQDPELAYLSDGRIDWTLSGLSNFVVSLQKNISQLTDRLDEIIQTSV